MRFVLVNKGLWSAVETDAPDDSASQAEKNAYQEKSLKALALIGLSVEDYHLATVGNAASAKAAWEALKNLYAQQSMALVVDLKRSLGDLRLKQGESITEYIGRAVEIQSQLQAAGHTLSDQDLILQVLCGLPDEYRIVSTIMENSDSQQQPSLSVVRSKLLREENRIARSSNASSSGGASSSTSPSELALYTNVIKAGKTKYETRKCNYCKKPGHLINDCNKRKAAEAKRSQQCSNCSGYGHYASECPSPVDSERYSSDTEQQQSSSRAHALSAFQTVAL
jgi:hypothetical protein